MATANEIGVRRSVVDYDRSIETKFVGAAKVERLTYVYALKLECGHGVTKKSTEVGVPQYAYCCKCKKKPRKRARNTLSARFA